MCCRHGHHWWSWMSTDRNHEEHTHSACRSGSFRLSVLRFAAVLIQTTVSCSAQSYVGARLTRLLVKKSKLSNAASCPRKHRAARANVEEHIAAVGGSVITSNRYGTVHLVQSAHLAESWQTVVHPHPLTLFWHASAFTTTHHPSSSYLDYKRQCHADYY